MILICFILLPLAGGLAAWILNRRGDLWARWVSLAAMLMTLALGLFLWGRRPAGIELSPGGQWLYEVKCDWVPQLGISFHLGMDGLSLLLVLLTAFLGVISVAASWSEIKERVGFFHFNLLWTLAGIMGVFLSLDLFLFYFFWELMLIPMCFLIGLWGHEDRVYAAVKFFIFTQASGLLMLLAILGLAFAHYKATGDFTFDYLKLVGSFAAVSPWLMLGFFVAFAVKLPMVPFHTWLPDAHTEAPTAGSVVLAGLLLKTGAYGFLRFVWPLFPETSHLFATAAMVLGVIGILYGAIMAFAQSDLKRLVAYTSVSHMGFVLLGVFAGNELSLQGAIIQIISHGVGTGAFFILIGSLQERIHTRDMNRMGGLWSTAPRMGATATVLALAAMGLPGLANFVGEFLVLIGTWKVSMALTAVAAVGMVISVVYSLQVIARVFHGPNTEGWKIRDYSARETAVAAVMIAVLVWLGIYPAPIFKTVKPVLDSLERNAISAPERQPPERIVVLRTGSAAAKAVDSVLDLGGKP